MRRIGQRGIISHAVYIFGILTSEAFTKACGGYGSKEITYLSLDHRHRLTLNINLKILNLFSSQKSQKIDVNQNCTGNAGALWRNEVTFLVRNDAQDLSCYNSLISLKKYICMYLHCMSGNCISLLNKSQACKDWVQACS